MMQKTQKQPMVGRILRMVSLAATVLTLTYCAVTLASFMDSDDFWVRMGLYLLLMPVLYLLEFPMLLLHEAGHMVGGWITGHRLCSISVMGWTLLRRGGRLRWGYEATPGIGGLCDMVTDKSPTPFVTNIFCGPLATLLAGGACACLAVRTYPSYDLYWDEAFRLALLHIPLTMLAVHGIRGGVVNLIPQRAAGSLTDGMQLWLLSRDRQCRADWEKLGRIGWEGYQGRELEDLPDACFEHPPIAADMNPYAARMAVLRLSRMLGQRDFSAALALCHALLDAPVAFDPIQQMCVVRTGALCEAMLDGPGPLYQRMQDRDMERLMQYTRRTRGTLMTRYAMAKLVSRDEPAARQHRAEYARAAARSPYRESVVRDEEFLRLVDERAEALKTGETAETP